MGLIDKDVLKAKIQNRIKETESMRSMDDPFWEGQISAFDSVLKILDTLETKDMDLEKEIQEVHKHFYDYYGIVNSDTNEFAKVDDIIHIAKHFFELGIKSKGE